MPIGKVWICRLLFVCLCLLFFVNLCVCTVTNFFAEDKASGIKFCTVVHQRPGHGISYFGELCSPEVQNGMYVGAKFILGLDHTRGPCASQFVQHAGHA